MTKPKPKPETVAEAVRSSIARENEKRAGDIKPIEIVKAAICSYQAFHCSRDHDEAREHVVESADKAGLRRGTQASVDRLLFNANYWLAAYEDQIIAACADEIDPRPLLAAVTVWSTHTLKLNTLGANEVITTFERFCPPFADNNRKGSGTGPVARFAESIRHASEESPACAQKLSVLSRKMQREADAYAGLAAPTALDALFAILPAWCLQDKIPLVSGGWWDDPGVVTAIAEELMKQFLEMGYGEATCQYFYDSLLESLDAYLRDISDGDSPYSALPVQDLIELVHNAREANPCFETDGYGSSLPAWLSAKEQLVWNVIACSLYGPRAARPLLVETPGLIVSSAIGEDAESDVITELAKSSFKRYAADRAETGSGREYRSFLDQPADLKNSGIEHIKSIPAKLETLGYEIVPAGSCYPDQRVSVLTPSEVECLAILEHRRWLDERTRAGWTKASVRNTKKKTSPYLVPWEELPDRAKEWNRSAIRNIPALLAGENLAIAKK